jgi:peptide chain release factor 3
VLQYRLKEEYRAESTLEMLPWKILRWTECALTDTDLGDILSYGVALARDEQGRRVLLFLSEWLLKNFQEKNPHIVLSDTPV